MLQLKIKIKDQTKAVVRAVKEASLKNLREAGAYIRGVARKSIKVSNSKAPPGKPPHSRKGKLKDAIVFSVEKSKETVVTGPTATEVGKIGHTHEFGGTEPPKKKKVGQNNWKLAVGGHGPIRLDGNTPVFAKLKTQQQVAQAKSLAPVVEDQARAAVDAWNAAHNKPRKYPARPFMGPALERSKERLPRLWRNSVRGG